MSDIEVQREVRTAFVRYGKMGLLGRFRADSPALRMRDRCIIRTERGREVGTITTQLEPVADGVSPETVGDIVRKATADDLKNLERIDKETRVKELQLCREEARKLGLQMKVVEVDHLYGGERVIIYFVSEMRIDFRELVRRLAHEFRTRIELKQVGSRDHARLVGDVGMCGRGTPCRTYLKELGGITMDMAKVQKHTADPSKITGVCGKLRCCLRFEYPAYVEARDLLPQRGVRIETRKGNGVVADQNLLLREVSIYIEGQEDRVVVRLDEIIGMPKTAPGCQTIPKPKPPEEEPAPAAPDPKVVEDAPPAEPVVVEGPPEPTWQLAGPLDDVKPGQGRSVQIAGTAVALFNVDGKIHASEAACPHQGGPLAEGKLEGCVVTCPLHQWKFNVATGEGVSGPSRVKTYEVRVDGGRIYVKI